jgi:hypothetical protein
VSRQSFSERFDFDIAVGPEEGNRAFFGQNVLQGLVDGIKDFRHERQARWRRGSYRIGGPVLLGCSPWVSDPALLTAIKALPACVVISKQPRTPGDTVMFQRLRQINKSTNGILVRALSGLAPKVDGRPLVVGPYEPIVDPDLELPTFRTIGYRKTGGRLPPHAHAKLALLGNICWTDEDPGDPDHIWFNAKRLWVSSANFTFPSRSSLEFGYWTENPELVAGVKRFLVTLIEASEDLDAIADTPDPDLVEVEFDHQAMAEASIEAERAEEELRWAEAELRGEEVDDEEW